MNVSRFGLVAAVLLAASACSGGTSSPVPSGGNRIHVTLADALRIEPATMSVPTGVPVTFVVTNTGASDHEFYLGDEADQAEHEREMQAMGGGMTHDEPEGIAVEPGETKELTFTFAEPGATLAGCHLPGHYASGMKADITVTSP